ncbi:MAG: type II toxin-antitoxin system RelE/ParE family toxin [Candidatus Eremiobacteraeota bacterium]|nr:type II toxin-antitoxin system RelE/ParE family toxin [Candidatus Eremiobacteraeota bacterium]
MNWRYEGTERFDAWYKALKSEEQIRVTFVIERLERDGPHLGRPYVDSVRMSEHANMKELRVQSGGDPLRMFFAFDPRRTAILLVGGNKSGDKHFYERLVPIADRLFAEHLSPLP